MDSRGNANHAISMVGNIFDTRIVGYNMLSLHWRRNNLQRFNPYFMLLDTVGHQIILKKDNHDTVN